MGCNSLSATIQWVMSTYIKESLYKELNSYFRPTTKVDPFTGLLSIKFKDLQESVN